MSFLPLVALVSRALRLKLVPVLALLAVAAPLAVPATASAACPSQATATTFGSFGDPASYFRAPNGGLESGALGWTLAGGARIASTNEPWKVGGPQDSHSLTLPAASGAIATSPPFCVTMSTPTARLFFRSDAFRPNDWGYLGVEAQYSSRTNGANLGRYSLAAIARHDGSWTPTAVIDLLTAAGLHGGLIPEANVRLIFTAHGSGAGSLSIDDVYVDPFKCC